MPMKWLELFGNTNGSHEGQKGPPDSNLDAGCGALRDPGLDVENSEVRHPVLLVLDCSDSMAPSVPTLNDGVADLIAHVKKDAFLAKCVELGIIRVADEQAELLQPLASPAQVEIPSLTASGRTPLFGGVLLAVATIERRREEYRAKGVDWKKAMVVVLTDGRATDTPDEVKATRAVHYGEKTREQAESIGFFIFASIGADMEQLNRLSTRGVEPFDKGRLRGVMDWLKASIHVVSVSAPDAEISLPDPKNFRLL